MNYFPVEVIEKQFSVTKTARKRFFKFSKEKRSYCQKCYEDCVTDES